MLIMLLFLPEVALKVYLARILKVGKLSLVERAISTCKQVPSISHILVSSDDADVLQIA